MGYYIRILGTQDPNISVGEVSAAIDEEKLKANLSIDHIASPENWSVLLISNEQGVDLAQVERNPVIDGELGKDELEEFREGIVECKPRSAAVWLDPPNLQRPF